MKRYIVLLIILLAVAPVKAQNFDLENLLEKTSTYTVSINVLIEVSFGIQTTEAKHRGIGTIVTGDGLVIFDGTPIDSEDPFSVMSGMRVTAEPKEIEIVMIDGTTYDAEFVGIDRFTKIGFCRIISDDKKEFDFVEFKRRDDFIIGEWLALFTLLPEYVSPPLNADIGLVSAIVKEPEKFILTVGFNELEIASVLYDSTGTPIGILGNLENPALSGFDATRMWDSFSQLEDFMPLLGLIDSDRLNKLIGNPPKRGKPDRGWMGVYLQALTPDIAEFWGIQSKGGIIINEVVKDSPADSAGIETGDVIIELFGKSIEVDKEENLPLFQKQISELGSETEVEFGILRRNESKIDTLDISFILSQAPLSPAEADDYEDLNFEMKVREMVFADYNMYNLDRRTFKGVVIKEVEPGGLFSIGRIYPGDIVQSIGGEKIETLEQAKYALNKLEEEKPKEVIFFIWRDNKTLFINIKTDW